MAHHTFCGAQPTVKPVIVLLARQGCRVTAGRLGVRSAWELNPVLPKIRHIDLKRLNVRVLADRGLSDSVGGTWGSTLAPNDRRRAPVPALSCYTIYGIAVGRLGGQREDKKRFDEERYPRE